MNLELRDPFLAQDFNLPLNELTYGKNSASGA